MAARRRRHTADEIVAILQEHTGGVTAQNVIRRHGISFDTLYRWKRKYGDVDRPEPHRLQALAATTGITLAQAYLRPVWRQIWSAQAAVVASTRRPEGMAPMAKRDFRIPARAVLSARSTCSAPTASCLVA
ncbi:MAG: transposase [Gemmatimonadales bacterium]|nr:transposase [Gemmatimonadales bacterium]